MGVAPSQEEASAATAMEEATPHPGEVEDAAKVTAAAPAAEPSAAPSLRKVHLSGSTASLTDLEDADGGEEKQKRRPSLTNKLFQPGGRSSSRAAAAAASPSPEIDTSEPAEECGRRNNTDGDVQMNLAIPFGVVSGVRHLADGTCCR